MHWSTRGGHSISGPYLKKISLQHNNKCFKVYPTENDKGQTETIAENKKNPRNINLVTTINLLDTQKDEHSVHNKDVVTYIYVLRKLLQICCFYLKWLLSDTLDSNPRTHTHTHTNEIWRCAWGRVDYFMNGHLSKKVMSSLYGFFCAWKEEV